MKYDEKKDNKKLNVKIGKWKALSNQTVGLNPINGEVSDSFEFG